MSALPYFGIRTFHTRAEAIAHANAMARRYLGVWRVFEIGEHSYRVLGSWGGPKPTWKCIHRAENWAPLDAEAAPF